MPITQSINSPHKRKFVELLIITNEYEKAQKKRKTLNKYK